MQFSDAVTSTGTPAMRVDSTSSAEIVLQDGSGGAAPLGWGWADNGWGVAGANIFFETTGTPMKLSDSIQVAIQTDISADVQLAPLTRVAELQLATTEDTGDST
ncbi:MAG: hypothetical protein AUH43_02135 [Acidobacteria bacterium 13_1_40CM_65_14]|nr:MAG: hypothetical protein AUH43_02135 [Acidobacteria bacterium 13_1_40CM_65_14]OLE80032.1 MAG: hypothetical protein AUF76_15320 [Acidobacteria bacterium 13_1_20CM_2_65_9]